MQSDVEVLDIQRNIIHLPETKINIVVLTQQSKVRLPSLKNYYTVLWKKAAVINDASTLYSVNSYW